MWRSVGFLMSFAIVIEGMTLIAYIVILAGGKQKREQGWKILSGLHFLVGTLQLASMAIIVSLSMKTNHCVGFASARLELTLGSLIGIPLRQRRSLLPRLEVRHIVGSVYHQLERHAPSGKWYHCNGFTTADGRRLRINTWG